jgi:gamma-glutamylaminecyclotransferase
MNKVFVYGTLKRGQRNYRFLQAAEFVGTFSTDAIFSMYAFDDYPAVCEQGRHAIQGEIYHVSNPQFRVLDELERYPDFYQRIVIPTHYGDAWMYIVKAELCEGKEMVPCNWL